jgi:hypothetical protein
MSARKIILDTTVYNRFTGISYYSKDAKQEAVQEDCEHDYPEQPSVDEDTHACWTCTKCGLVRCYEVWD